MRNITLIVVHCTAGPQTQRAADIVRYHTLPPAWRAWMERPRVSLYNRAVGQYGASMPDRDIAHGAKGHNGHSIHVAYVGGVDTARRDMPAVDNRTEAQKTALRRLLEKLRCCYPSARIVGHRNLSRKACPSFDAMKEYADL